MKWKYVLCCHGDILKDTEPEWEEDNNEKGLQY